MEASITLKKVGKLVGDKTILAGLTFGVERGSLVAIVGANDSGKSSLLKLLSGFENPDYGQVFLHGLDMNKRRNETRMLVGYVSDATDLDPWLTLKQNILFTAANGNQLTGEISLPMFRWLCPFDTLYGGGKSGNFEEGYIDSVVSFKSIEDGLLVIYGEGDECDDN